MSNRNHKKPHVRRKKGRYGLGRAFVGLMLLAAGIVMNLNISRLEEVPLWATAGPMIDIYQEDLCAGEIDVECLVEDGSIDLKLFAGSRQKEAVTVWMLVTDVFFPYQWKTYGMDEMLAGHIETMQYEAPENFPEEKILTALKSQKQEGETQRTWFAATLEPGKGGCRLHMEMDPESLVYEKKGNRNIRLPQISAGRDSLLYETDSRGLKDFLESGEEDLRAFFSSYMINGNVLAMPDLNISSVYRWDGDRESYCRINSIRPDPSEIGSNYIIWNENVLWIPEVVIHDTSYEKQEVFFSLLGGMFITVGSGMVVAPASWWLKQGQPGLQKKRKRA